MHKTDERLWLLAAALMGLACCYAWVGPVVLEPTSVEWLNRGDRAMHTLGWWFFREAPWGWPPGASPKLGLELASGVALSDSLPLFAFPAKLLSPLLPPMVQYWGIWIMLCFALQAVFGYLLARALKLGQPMALAAALFCVFQPAFLDRITGHMALGGHWTILAALYLYVRPAPPSRLVWPLLMGVVAAVHGYLMALCGAIWLAAMVQRLWMRQMRPQAAMVELVVGVAALAAVMWAGGIFMVRSFGSGGYGLYQLNLLALIDPTQWSYVFPDLPQTAGDYEGLSFMGAGVLFMVVATAMAVLFFKAPLLAWEKLRGPRWLPIVVVGIGLTLFAMTNKIAVGSFELPALPLPSWVINFAAIFRASARMFWPVGYLLLFAVVMSANRALGRRALWLALPLLLVQVLDTSKGWSRFHYAGSPQSAWTTELKDPTWDALAMRYQRIRGVPVTPIFRGWKDLSYLALRHHIGIDAAYLARVDGEAYRALALAGERALIAGEFDTDAIYVMGLGAALLAERHAQAGDLLSELDGRYVFARGGAERLMEAGLPVPERRPDARPLQLGTIVATIEKNNEALADYLPLGWSAPEVWGIWTDGTEATLVFSLSAAPRQTLHLFAAGLPQADGSPQRVTVLVNDQLAGEYELATKPTDVTVPLPPGLAGDVFVRFRPVGPVRPSDLGQGSDTRLLGMALRSFELRQE